jgi:hypothetical protein
MVKKSVGLIRRHASASHAAIDFDVDREGPPEPNRSQSIDLMCVHDDKFEAPGGQKTSN